MKLMLSSQCSWWWWQRHTCPEASWAGVSWEPLSAHGGVRGQLRRTAHESQGGDPPRASGLEIAFSALRIQPRAEAAGLWLECRLNRPAFYGNLKTLDIKAAHIYMQVFGERERPRLACIFFSSLLCPRPLQSY